MNHLRNGNYFNALKLMMGTYEDNRTRMGYSGDEPSGSGMGEKKSRLFLQALRRSRPFETGDIEDIEDAALFVESVSNDMISDMMAAILREKLVEYTQDQCNVHGIALDTEDRLLAWRLGKGWVRITRKLPSDGLQTILLVPRSIVRSELSLQPDKYLRSIYDACDQGNLSANEALAKMLQQIPRKAHNDIHRGQAFEQLTADSSLKGVIGRIVGEDPGSLKRYKDSARASQKCLSPSQLDSINPRHKRILEIEVAAEMHSARHAFVRDDAALKTASGLLKGLHPYIQHPIAYKYHKNRFTSIVMANAVPKGLLADARYRYGQDLRSNLLVLAKHGSLSQNIVSRLNPEELMKESGSGMAIVCGDSLDDELMRNRLRLSKIGLFALSTSEVEEIGEYEDDPEAGLEVLSGIFSGSN